jgi:mRNA-degrading endonuclease RelE of RelBE toxin-antitoxin system
MMAEIIFEESPEFKKDLKRLRKRYRTLPDDFNRVKHVAIKLFHNGVDNRACFEIPGCVKESCSAYKLKKFACRSLKGGANSGLRVIYIFDQLEKKVLFIEMYYKGDQALENRERIKFYLS